MSEDSRIAALRAFLERLGVSEGELSRRIQAGLPVEFVREQFELFLRDGKSGVYAPVFFESDNVEQLRRVILSAPADVDYEEYWDRSGRVMARTIATLLGLTPDSRVLDFGCGIGRLARPVIQTVGCRVTGVDLSHSMLATAVGYVDSPNFTPIHHKVFHAEPGAPLFTGAYCALVLQHCLRPDIELAAIRRACVAGAPLLIVNAHHRFLPTAAGWQDDGVDVLEIIRSMFHIEQEIDLSGIPELRFDPAADPTTCERDHFAVLVHA